MGPHLGEVTLIANVVADPVLIHITPVHRAVGDSLSTSKRFENRAGVSLAAAQVVHLGHAWRLPELEHEACDILRVDIIPYLLSLVTIDLIFPSLDVAFDEITQKTVQLDARVIRSGETPTPQAAGRHIKVAAVFLDHDVGGDFG